jgi:hypothetical protein
VFLGSKFWPKTSKSLSTVWYLCKLIIGFRDIVSGMDVAEMEESFHEYHEGDYHPFKNGSILLE